MTFLKNTVIFLSLLANSSAGEWPGWRGPTGDGVVPDEKAPLEWSIEKDVKWKVKIPGKGHASPIIWGDELFLVSADEESGERLLMCLSIKTGKTLWQKTVLESPIEKVHRKNSRASSTPVTDGKSIYVSFLDQEKMFIAAYNLEGKKLWEKRPGIFSSVHGYCSSPILWKDKVIINGDHDGNAYIVALNKETGSEAWKTPRPNKTRSYCTPLIRTIGGRNQLILSGSKSVASYDPDTGKQHWIIDGPTDQFVASLVYDQKYLYMTCGFPSKHMMAIDPTGSGNVTETHVIWHTRKNPSYVPSPVVVKGYYLVVSDSGTATCWRAHEGKLLWKQKLGREHSASLVVLRDHVVFGSEKGLITVVKPGPEFEEIAKMELSEPLWASPVIADGNWFLRGEEHLFCIEKRN
ncbi:PQQ-binding-like beta-propeller repeat protein [Akkermansiaceae bacterium]|jgi:outer membrane protein assembly factor BamB|nr:PQQ-binding-like beta-propeller repeat protein [Akkermansiaceae bacterium]